MFSRFSIFIFILGAVLVGTAFIVRPEIPGNFLGKTSALLSETFGNVFGLENSRTPAAIINLDEEALTGESDSALPSNSPTLKESPSESAQANRIIPSVPGNTPAKTAAPTASGGSLVPIKKREDGVKLAQTPECAFLSAGEPSHAVVFGEIAWMGSPSRGGESASAAANNEWIELKNIGPTQVDLAGWQVLDESTNFRIMFDNGLIPTGGLYLLERTDDDSVPGVSADKVYSGALSNSGAWLRLFDAGCDLADEIDGRGSWPAGDNSTKQTMERSADYSWHASALAGGTPKAENAENTTNDEHSTTNEPNNPTSATPASATKYNLAVSMQGDGAGKIISSPAGINCGFDCLEEFPAGTQVVLTATPETNSSFEGWSGACSSNGDCKFTISNNTSVMATFKSTLPPQYAPPPPPPASSSGGKILISEIFYDAVGADDGKEFIELYNTNANSADITGWALRKSDGSSLAVIGQQANDKKIIPASGFFLIGFSGYSGSPSADAVRSASLAHTTTTRIDFYDANGALVESVAYPASCSGCVIQSGQSYERQPLTESGQFVAQPNPNPQNSGQ